MNIWQGLRALDRKVGIGPREGESRRDFLERCARWPAYVPREVYRELIELHDRVAVLEAELEHLKGSPGTEQGLRT